MGEVKFLADEEKMVRMMKRLAHEIIEQSGSADTVYLVGIKRRGVPIAKIIRENIETFSDLQVELGELDITLYRDDLSENYPDAHLNGTKIDFDVNGKSVILVDDVLYTGRTARAAMEALIALGRPSKIQLLVLVDRGHRELPISANFVGKNVPTSKKEFVAVHIEEYDGDNAILIEEKR